MFLNIAPLSNNWSGPSGKALKKTSIYYYSIGLKTEDADHVGLHWQGKNVHYIADVVNMYTDNTLDKMED